MEGVLAFGVLGPLAVTVGTDLIEFPRRKERQLLTALLLTANRTLSTDQLIDAVWGDDPPTKPLASLRACISNIRKVLPDHPDGGSVVITDQGGYQLRIRPETVDAVRYEQLLTEARATRAAGDQTGTAALLDEAIGLIRGEPLANMAYDDFTQREISRLSELIVAGEELRAQVAVELGEAEAWLPRISELVAAHPLRELIQATQMTALYQLGRQAEALRSYQTHRRTMIEELGIEPAAELQELEAKILARDQSLNRPEEPQKPNPSSSNKHEPPDVKAEHSTGESQPSAPLRQPSPRRIVGRATELRVLDGLAPGFGFVIGESGSGKSALVETFLDQLAASGWRTASGSCLDDDGVPPLWPWRQVVRDLDLTHAVSLSGADETNRFDLFDDVTSSLLEAAATGPIALFIDDLQWADDNTLRLIAHFGRRLRSEQLVFIGSARTAPDALSSVPATWIELGSLTVGDIDELVEAATGQSPEPGLAGHLWERTGGNAYFVTELIDFARNFGEDVRPDLEVPSHVRQLVRQRIQVLPERTAALLEVAALELQNFSPAIIAEVLETDAVTVQADLKPAIDAGIVLADRTAFGRYRFDHAITRETIEADADPMTSISHHAALGRALEAAVSPHAEQYATELSRHYGLGAQLGTAEEAIRWARVAADRAADTWSHRDGIVHLRRAIDAEGHLPEPDPRVRCETMLALGRFSRLVAEVDTAEEALFGAYRLAEELGDVELLARAALAMAEGMGAGHWRWYWNPGTTALVAMQRALQQFPEVDSPLRAKLMAQLAADGLEAIPLAERQQLLDDATAMAERLDQTLDIARIGCYRRAAIGWTWDEDETLAHDREILALFASIGVESGELSLRGTVMADLITMGDLAGARREFEQLELEARLRGSLTWRFFALQWEIFFAQLAGRWHEANRLAGKALEPASGIGEDLAGAVFYQMQITNYLKGEISSVIDTMQAGLSVCARPLFSTMLLNSLAVSGRTEDAMQLLKRIDPLEPDLDEMGGRLVPALGTEALVLLGQTERLNEAIEFLLPTATEMAMGSANFGGLIFFGPMRYYLALAMVGAARYDEAAEQLRLCRLTMDSLAAAPHLIRLDYVAAELEAGRNGLAAAEPRFAEVRAAAAELDMAGLVSMVDRARMRLQ